MRQGRRLSIQTSACLAACAGLLQVRATAQLLDSRTPKFGWIDSTDLIAQKADPPHPVPSKSPPVPASIKPSTSDILLANLDPFNRWRTRFGLIASGIFDSNIFIQSTNEKSDYYFIIAPEFAVGSGDFFQQLELRRQSFRLPDRFENADLVQHPSPSYIYLAYTPSYTAFVDHTNLNSFDQDAIFEIQHRFTKLALSGFARYQSVKLPDIDLGTRVGERFTYAQATATYDWTPKSKLTDQFYLQYRDYQVGVNALEMWDEFWYDYQITAKTRLGSGIAAGAIYPDAGPDQYYGRVQARATWKPTSRLTLAAKCGIEYHGVKNRGERAYPIFGLEGDFNFSDRTSVSLSVSQTVTTSADREALDYVARSVAVKIEQKIADRFRFDLTGGYQNLEYDDAFSARRGEFARTDNYFYIQPALNLTLLRWLSCDLTFEYRKDASTEASKSFHEFLTGVHFNIAF